MNNSKEKIFEKAEFGDRFMFDGHDCVLIYKGQFVFTLMVDDAVYPKQITADKYGYVEAIGKYVEPHPYSNNKEEELRDRLDSLSMMRCSEVSRLQSEISRLKEIDEKRLEELADKYEESLPESYTWNESCDDGGIHGVCSVCEIEKAYKAGYRQAKTFDFMSTCHYGYYQDESGAKLVNVDKACRYLRNNLERFDGLSEDFVQGFKEAMEK